MIPSTPWSLTARWLLPVDGPPLQGGSILHESERHALGRYGLLLRVR